MKFAVNNVSLYTISVVFLASLAISNADTCQCATPPGGEISCPSGHSAFCRIYDGKVYGGCEPNPKGLTGDGLKAWALSKVFGTRIEPAQIESNALFERTLKTGRYENPKTREVVTFKLSKGDGN